MNTPSGNAVIAQSGGPTAVANQSLVGCVETVRSSGAIQRVYGARHGVRGMISGDFIDLTDIPHDRWERIAVTPSAALGSSRDRPDRSDCQRIFEQLASRNIRYVFYIGGNDTADTCRILSEAAVAGDHDLRCFHIPKTIDNDLLCNDHTPGFGSAARFVANAFKGDNLDNAALPAIKIDVIMGRNAGFLTASSALAREYDDDGPHLIYLPERIFDPEEFVEDVAGVHAAHGRCLIAVSEGIQDRAGNSISVMMSQLAETDEHGNIQLSGTGALGDALADRLRREFCKQKKKLRIRADTFGYMQRTFYDASPVDQREARAVGENAAMLALNGVTSGSVTIKRVSTDPYYVEYGVAELSEVAARTRPMEPEFLCDDRPDVTPEFIRYVTPLVGRLAHMERLT